MIIDLVKNKTKNIIFSINDKFKTDMKDVCPIISYAIVKVIVKNSEEPMNLTDCSKKFQLDS